MRFFDMKNNDSNRLDIELPKGLVVFISGVPGVGKTTISYELLRMFDEFRIVEETDLIREALRGYSEYIKDSFEDKELCFLDEIEIAHNKKFLRYGEAKKQCEHMKKSFEKIVRRQKRKGISTIINGVHIVPEVLDGFCEIDHVLFFNLSLNNKSSLCDRWTQRDSKKYNTKNLSIAFQTNIELSLSTRRLSKISKNIFFDIDVTNLSIAQTKAQIVKAFSNLLQNP